MESHSKTFLNTLFLMTGLIGLAPIPALAVSATPTVIAAPRPTPVGQRELNEQLWLACLSGNLGMLRQLVDQGANPKIATRNGETALHAAAARGHVQIVQYLIQLGVSVNARTTNGWTPLHHAARFGHVSVANILLRKGANPWIATYDAKKSAIQMALDRHDLRMARVLGWR
ncbi:MAG: ankyrin repeat domain-containing protein [Thiothrix sp.]|nr:ankyrin repeat domain-containing protein [Thiothrix sp.]HPQ94233.1 ankyrin repeat domain-containing protein [Thiolinea sp.]